MVLQMCSMALRMTGSLVSSSWCLQETQQIGKNPFTLSTETTKFLFPSRFIRFCFFSSLSYLMKTSMMDLQTSTLTLSFWNMSRNGRKRSWWTEDGKKNLKNTSNTISREQFGFVFQTTNHGEEDGKVVEVGEDFPDHWLQLPAEQEHTEVITKKREK